ncbi:ATP-binding protein [uncultured Phocaeicola sp.]|uniref:sensor histidine kinase n=1 Tax=uncultured Phocaeicola sp. TaxID=990718 RepID=UPI0032201E06
MTDLLTAKEQHLDVNISDKFLCELEPLQMERTIQNILVNAVRYSPKGELIRISLSKADNIICCEIENTGVHIDENAIKHFFEPFYRIDTSRDRNTGGTGLGLYIVCKIMEIHHAKYSIRNSKSGVLFYYSKTTDDGDTCSMVPPTEHVAIAYSDETATDTTQQQ